MLLTLAVSSLRSLRSDAPRAGGMSIFDVPEFAIRQLQLRGLNVPASMLAGRTPADLERLRDCADKAACPCLLLVGDDPLNFASNDASVVAASKERLHRLAAAAYRLGCNGIAIGCAAENNDKAFERTATELKAAINGLERYELNVLLMPIKGLTTDATRLTDLIKRIGGFRIGSLPTFAHAEATGNVETTLRKLAPYAGAIHASIGGFDGKGKHVGADLERCVAAIRSVGYANTIGIEYQGNGDPVVDIERARGILQAAIDAEPGS